LAVPGSGRHWQEYETEFTICEDQVLQSVSHCFCLAIHPLPVQDTPLKRLKQLHQLGLTQLYPTSQEFAGRLLAMCTVEGSGGLSKVFNAILKPGSSSFQIVSAPDTLVGKTFKDLQVKNP